MPETTPVSDQATPVQPAETTAAETSTAPTTAPARKRGDGKWWWGVGRRKSAVARVRIQPGEGKFIVNKRPSEEYFTEERDQKDLANVLEKTNTKTSIDIHVNVRGGGYTGQGGYSRFGPDQAGGG